MNNSVTIAMISDTGFIMPTCVAIQSLKCNRNQKTKYTIYVFLNDCETECVNNIKRLESDNYKIIVRNLPKLPNYNTFINENVSATPTALYKFHLPQLLPEYDKVLYLDGDLLIQKDLLELYNIELKDNYVAAVKDMPLMTKQLPQMKLLMQYEKNYFNSGVMLLNLKKMRQENTTEKLFEYKKLGINTFMDQDAFNVIFAGKVIFISIYYNMVFRVVENNGVDRICNFYDIPFETNIESLYNKAVIIHLASKYKPWINYTPVLTDWFIKYYSAAGFSETELEIGNRVAPLFQMRKIPHINRNNNNLVICENTFELFQAIRFFYSHCSEEIDILLTPCLKGYKEKLKETSLFANIYISAENSIESLKVQNAKDFSDKYFSKIYLFNIKSEHNQIFYNQCEKGFYAEIVCLDSGVKSYLNNFKQLPSPKKNNIFNYISKWYVDDVDFANTLMNKDYIFPMPSIQFLPSDIIKMLFKEDILESELIFFTSDDILSVKKYETYFSIIDETITKKPLVITKDIRLQQYCKEKQLAYKDYLSFPINDIFYLRKKTIIISDGYFDYTSTLLERFDNIMLIDLSYLFNITDSNQIPKNLLSKKDNIFFPSDKEMLFEILNVIK